MGQRNAERLGGNDKTEGQVERRIGEGVKEKRKREKKERSHLGC